MSLWWLHLLVLDEIMAIARIVSLIPHISFFHENRIRSDTTIYKSLQNTWLVSTCTFMYTQHPHPHKHWHWLVITNKNFRFHCLYHNTHELTINIFSWEHAIFQYFSQTTFSSVFDPYVVIFFFVLRVSSSETFYITFVGAILTICSFLNSIVCALFYDLVESE